VPGMRCDGMDVVDTHHVTSEALRMARDERRPVLVEAVTYRFRGHSMADPEEYRSREQVEEWRRRDPIVTFGNRLVAEDVITDEDLERFDAEAIARVDEAVAFADASPFPPPESLYDDVYVLGDQVRGVWSVDTLGRPDVARAARDGARAEIGEVPERLSSAIEAGEDT
jgi:pyruvate dehydrogenase E1 component alpha subunit